MPSTTHNYEYIRSHYETNYSWYRELVRLDEKIVGEITESVDSTMADKIYQVRKYVPFKLDDGNEIEIANVVTTFPTIVGCKDFINNGGIK